MPDTTTKCVDVALLDALTEKARSLPRLRANYNLHPTESDPVQRFLNAIEPGSYVRPHRHVNPPKWELFTILRGRAVVLLFNDAGTVTERYELSAAGPLHALEIAAGRWHTIAAVESGTVLFEYKAGPYQPLADKDFAAWAPSEGAPSCIMLEMLYRTAGAGDCLAGRVTR